MILNNKYYYIDYINMNEVQLPIVNFGKYKGKCVTELLSDSDYIEWLKQQSWLEKHKNIYNIIINQNLSSNTNSKTPEHNKLQNKFLNEDNQKILINHFKLEKYKIAKIIFEDKFNWDFCLYIDVKTGTGYFSGDFELNVYCCELKPTLSDDYPSVLRKMKNQIQLMKINNEMYYHCIDLFNKDYNSDKTKYILLIKSFTSESTSIEELKKIFKQSNIDVIFTYELFTDKLLDLNVTEKLTYSELLEENKKLKELLKKFEDKK